MGRPLDRNGPTTLARETSTMPPAFCSAERNTAQLATRNLCSPHPLPRPLRRCIIRLSANPTGAASHARHRHSRRHHHRRHRPGGLHRRRRDRRRADRRGRRQGGAGAARDRRRRACWSRPAGSTCTRITTGRRCGTRCWRRPPGMASRRSCSAIAASASRRCSKHHRGALIDLMEGVEDIPGPVLADGPHLGVGELSRFPRCAGAEAARDRCRGAGRASAAARLCDGRPRHPARGGDAARTSPRCAA